MADGRMLKKAISTSRRLADLKTDSARMLYTWIIPHLDVEGRFYADPSMVKGSVVPRVKSFSEIKISDCLQDMADVGLILLYGVDGDKYLQLRKFEDHQNIKKDRESPSKIPTPPDEPNGNSGVNPENSGVNPEQVKSSAAQDKIREDKIREDKDYFILPEWIPKETWEAYLKLRDKKKAAKTTYALKLIIKELERIKTEFKQYPVDVLNKSIKSGWIDVYPLKEKDHNLNKAELRSLRNAQALTEYINSGDNHG